MKDKDKLYVIYYLNISTLPIPKARQQIAEICKFYADKFDETVSFIIVPVSEPNNKTRIEVFNVDKITEEENIERLNTAISTLEKYINDNLIDKDETDI